MLSADPPLLLVDFKGHEVASTKYNLVFVKGRNGILIVGTMNLWKFLLFQAVIVRTFLYPSPFFWEFRERVLRSPGFGILPAVEVTQSSYCHFQDFKFHICLQLGGPQ
mmetsp:Transcript_17270/g.38961  ORF Transcript_17270/g.38961 Transcript_17270/m.38961 type:complete len:108 (+) Transcript_17270:2234-2557(+)